MQDVISTPEISHNLVFVNLLSKVGTKLLFDFDRVVMTRIGVLVSKDYYMILFMYRMLKVNKNVSSTYIVGSLDTWNSRLDHVNVHTLKGMKNRGYLKY